MIKNSTIILTGSTGFIGANLLKALLRHKPHKIHIIIRKTSNLWRIKDILKNPIIEIHYGSLLNKKLIKNIFELAQPDLVYHCATYGMFLNKQKNKEKIIKTNVLSLFYLLEQSAHYKIKKFINTGSTSEYGVKNKVLKENMVLEPNNTYGATKSAGTILASQLAKEYKLNLMTLRLSSPYGYFEAQNRLFPYVILNYLKGNSISLYSQNAVRDFVFIDDVIQAYLLATKSKKVLYGDVFNIGTGRQHKIIDVIRTLEKIEHKKINVKWGEVSAKQQEPKIWKVDNSKMQNIFGWSPKYTLIDGLTKNLLWFKKNKNLYLRS